MTHSRRCSKRGACITMRRRKSGTRIDSSSAVSAPIRWISDILFPQDELRIRSGPIKPRPGPEPGFPKDTVLDRQPAGPPLSSTMIAGTIQLIGLTRVRATLGAKWEIQSERIFHLIESVLRRRLDVTDAYFRVNDENYLVLFTRLQKREGQFKAQAISQEIEKLLLGETSGGDGIQVASAVVEIDRALVMEKIGSLDELLHHVREGLNPASPDRSNPTDADPIHVPELSDDFSNLFPRITVEEYLRRFRVVFRPMYNLRKRRFGSFLAVAQSMDTGLPIMADVDPMLARPEELPGAADRFVLGAAILGLQRMLTGGIRAKVVIPVSFETIATARSREAYFIRLRNLPAGIRQYVTFMIVEVPADIPRGRLAEVIAYLHPISRMRFPHLPLDIRRVDAFAGTGCFAFSTEAPVLPAAAGNLLGMLTAFAKRATLQGGLSVLGNVNSIGLLQTGVTAGFAVVWGDAICGTVDTPGAIITPGTEHIARPS